LRFQKNERSLSLEINPRASEKPVDILVTVPRACGPEDLDPSNYEHFHKAQSHPGDDLIGTGWGWLPKPWEVSVGINNLITIPLYEGNAFVILILQTPNWKSMRNAHWRMWDIL